MILTKCAKQKSFMHQSEEDSDAVKRGHIDYTQKRAWDRSKAENKICSMAPEILLSSEVKFGKVSSNPLQSD